MDGAMLDRDRYVLGDPSAHVGLLNCERIAERSEIHRWKVETHFHEGLSQLFVFSKGCAECRIDSQLHHLQSRALIWAPALCSHGFDYEAGMQGWVITIPTADVTRLVAGRSWLQSWIARPKILSGAQHGNRLAEAEWLVRQIEKEHRDHGEERNLALESLFLLLMINLHRGIITETGLSPSVTDRKQILVCQFQNLLDRHMHETRSVADYAAMMSITPTHLSRTIRSVTGRTAGEIIQDRVLLEAKRQLIFTDRTVVEIACMLQFSSPSYFTRFFSARTSESPTSYRRRARNADLNIDPNAAS